MKDSEVYLKAAEDVVLNRSYSCLAIDKMVNGGTAHSPERTRFAQLFKDDEANQYLAWLENPVREREDWTQEDFHQWRVLALLFMHQIAKDEEKANG